MDPFVTGLEAIFNAFGSEQAIYRPSGNGTPRAIRIIRSTPDREINGTILATTMIEIRKAEVPAPVKGDTVQTASGFLVLQADAQLDVEGLTWKVGAEPE